MAKLSRREFDALYKKYKVERTRMVKKRMLKSKTVWTSFASVIGGIVLVATGISAPVGANMIGTGLIGMFLREGVEQGRIDSLFVQRLADAPGLER